MCASEVCLRVILSERERLKGQDWGDLNGCARRKRLAEKWRLENHEMIIKLGLVEAAMGEDWN